MMNSVDNELVERRLGVSERRLAGILEIAEDAIISIDKEHLVTLFNHGAEKIFGYSAQEMIGQPLDILLPPRFVHTHREHIAQFAHTDDVARRMGKRREHAGRRKDGTEFPAEASISKLELEGETIFTVMLRDITERKRAEEQIGKQNRELLESAAFTNNILESSTEYSIIAIDLDGQVLAWNEGAKRNYGYTADEMVGKRNANILFMEEDVCSGRTSTLLETTFQTGKAEGIFECVRGNGECFTAALDVTLRKNSEGKPIGYLVISKDITEQNLLQAELQRKNEELLAQYQHVQEASRLKSAFLANMSHELRTPLNAIIGFSELIHDGRVGPVSDTHKEYLGDILTSSRHLLHLINDVLDLAKIESGKMEFTPENVNMIKLVGEVRGILRGIAAKKRITLNVAVAPDLDIVVTDPSKLKQVLYNYLSNAIKFTPEEGQVNVRVKAVEGDAFRIEVEDNGIGIRPEDIGRLFVEFHQLDATATKKYQGTGLGLALTKRIVETQGGKVGVQSTPGVGSTFFAILPRGTTIKRLSTSSFHSLTNEVAAHGISRHSIAPLHPGAASILVVEDNPNNQKWLMDTLAGAGYNVQIASTGAEAIELAQGTAYDAITLDLLLAYTNGWEVLSTIRSGGPNRKAPVIAVTMVEEKWISASYLIHDILTKPVQTGDLLASLERAGVPSNQANAVLIMDDHPSILKILRTMLTKNGYLPVCARDGTEGLRLAEKRAFAAVVLDLVMLGKSALTFLERYRQTSAGANTPIIVWTNRDLSRSEMIQDRKVTHAVLSKGEGGMSVLLDMLSEAVPLSVVKRET